MLTGKNTDKLPREGERETEGVLLERQERNSSTGRVDVYAALVPLYARGEPRLKEREERAYLLL